MRLGDLDDLKVHISELMLVYSGTELDNAILKAIDNAPTVIWCNETSDGLPLMDLRPRPQGEWIRYRDNPHQPEHIKCSNCGQYWSVADHDKTFDFCFKCGAYMRKGGKNE